MRSSLKSRRFLLLCGLLGSLYCAGVGLTWFLQTSVYAAASATSAEASFLTSATAPKERQLKAAILNAQSKLQRLEPWQKILFHEEVVPQYQRFIRDYRSSGNKGLEVDIDYESLRHYLVYYAPRLNTQANAQGIDQKENQILVLLKAGSACEKCQSSLTPIQNLVRARLQRRGLTPVWLSAEDYSAQLSNRLLFDQLLGAVKTKNALGALLIAWSPAPLDDADSAHAEEEKYWIESSFQIGTFGVQVRTKEVLDSDQNAFETASARLLTDLLTDLGMQVELEQSHRPDSHQQEILVTIHGVTDYNHYLKIKSILTNQLKEVQSLEDRKFSKNQIVFAVFTSQTALELKQQMTKLPLDSVAGSSSRSGQLQPLQVIVQ